MSFGPVRRANWAASSFVALRRTVVAPLSVAILRAGTMRGMTVTTLRMPLRTGVAVLAALAVMATVGLGHRALGTLHDRRLEALERVG